MARGAAPTSTRTAVVSLSQRGAARVPRVRAVDDDAASTPRSNPGVRATSATSRTGCASSRRRRRATPVLRDEVQRRRAVGRRGGQPADHARCCPGRPPGALGAALIAGGAGVDQVLTCDGGGTSTDVTVVRRRRARADHRGHRSAPTRAKIPMIDVVTVGAGGGSIAWISPEGTLQGRARSRPAPIPGRSATARAAPSRPSPTRTWCSAGSRRTCSAARSRSTPSAARTGRRRSWPPSSGCRSRTCATGILEISAWNQANALRQITVKRGLDVRDFTLVTFGGSGSLLACRLIDILGLDGVLVPPNPGNVSAFGLLTVDVRNDYVQTARAPARPARPRSPSCDRSTTSWPRRPGARWPPRVSRRDAASLRSAPPTCGTSARPSRCGYRSPTGRSTRSWRTRSRGAFHDAHRALYGYDFRGDPRQQVEWVNLRVTGIGPIRRPELTRDRAPVDGARTAPSPAPARSYFDRAGVDHRRSTTAPGSAPGDEVAGPAVIEEFGSTVPVHPGFRARVDVFGNLVSPASDSTERTDDRDPRSAAAQAASLTG